MSSIYGGFEARVYTSSGVTKNDGTATNRGVATRLNPIIDPGNIDIRGTGKRGLYDILLGMREPQFAFDLLPSTIKFIADYQDGQTEIPWLHYRFTGGDGLTFKNVAFNRCSVESRHNQAIQSSIECWADEVVTLGSPSWGALVETPYRWLDSVLTIATVIETEWWSWRYEVVNNLQRLGNVDDGGTRDIKARHRGVTGMIIKDLASFTEWITLQNVASEQAKFNITIQVDGEDGPGSGAVADLLNCDYSRWGRLEAPTGPEDLIAKRFPFTSTDLT